MMLQELRQFQDDLRALKTEVNKEKGPRISKNGLRARAEALSTRWFSELSPTLSQYSFLSAETIERFSSHFAILLKLSKPSNHKSRYINVLGECLRKFHDDLILPIQKQPKVQKEVSALVTLLSGLPDLEEDEYLQEAVACASAGLFRGAAVLGWCATIDRIHRVIEKIGFNKFNTVSQQMAASQSGRFKRFRKSQSITSLSELREVFDTDILWILEGMQLIDSNQHTRLRSCFDLRCQCAHPGDAPVTEYNLLSFFSDMNAIVLRNPKFQLVAAPAGAAPGA
jgi:hypothetical protein